MDEESRIAPLTSKTNLTASLAVAREGVQITTVMLSTTTMHRTYTVRQQRILKVKTRYCDQNSMTATYAAHVLIQTITRMGCPSCVVIWNPRRRTIG